MVEGRGIRFHSLPATAGLSQTRVSDIVQDDDGFIWFGTQNGLNRFDGYKCKVFLHDALRPESLSGVYIHALFKDRSGFIWVASDQFLDRLDPVTEVFTHYSLVEPDRNALTITVGHISQDSSGLLWLSTNMGLFRLDPTTKQFTPFVHNSQDLATIGDNDVTSAGEDRQGTFWVTTAQTLDEFDRGTGKVIRHIATPRSGIGSGFHEDRFGVLWIFYGHDGLPGILDRTSGRLTRFQFNPKTRRNRAQDCIHAMLEDHNGNMWFGSSESGVLEFDREHRRFVSYNSRLGDSDSLTDSRVTTLFEDREGTIWVGLHEAEPNFFTPRRPFFEKFTHQSGNPNSLDAPLVSAVYEDRKGILWVGSDHGVTLVNRMTEKYSRLEPLSTGSTVLSVIEQGSDIVWLGTDSGIKGYNRNTGALKEYPVPRGATYGCNQSVTQRLLVDKDGTLWGASWEGLCHFDPATQTFTRFKPEDNNWGLNYHDIVRDRDGKLWVGSEIGLHRFDPQASRFTIYSHRPDDPHSLSDDRVNSVYIDHVGTLWAGTQNGLDKFDPRNNSFSEFGEQQGMLGSVVSCVLEDRKGSLWMSTNKGLSNFDPRTGIFKNYTVADGPPGDDLTGWGACFKSSTGEMFFGGFSGAVAFFPDRIADDTLLSPIVLTDFRLLGNSVPLGKNSLLTRSIGHTGEVTLSHAQNVFGIEFSALSYLNAETNRYRYRLDGFDGKWNEVDSAQRVAAYTALPHGTYTFRVEAASRHGHWSEPGATLRIQILPAWWQTFWFRSLSVFAAFVMVWLVYVMRLRHVTQRVYDRLCERAEEREQIARNLHDTFFQSIQGLLLRFHTATSRLPEGHPARPLFEEALKESDVVMAEGRELLVDLHGTASKPNDLSTTLANYGERMQGISSGTFKVAVNGNSRALNPIVFEELSCIGKEALGNAFRHSMARSIEAELTYEPHEVSMRIRDNGVGIEEHILKEGRRDGHLGLESMRERSRNIGAQLDLWSRTGVGTEVELRIPAGLAYTSGSNGKRKRFWQRGERKLITTSADPEKPS